MLILYVTNFDAPDTHFNYQTECHEIEPNLSKDRAMPEGENPSFWDEFTKFSFFLDSSIHIRILK
jgi:hypothetical protein